MSDGHAKSFYLPTILLGVVVAVIFLLAIFTYQVPATERALILTMGKPAGTADPGLHLRWPMPFQEIVRYDIRRRTFDGNVGKLAETTTRDQRQVVVGISVIYRIRDLERYKSASSRASAEDYLGSVMLTVKQEVIGQYDRDQLINTDPAKMKLDEMREKILERMRDNVMNAYGLEVCDVFFSSIGVPQKTAAAIAGRMKQERETAAAEKLDKGKTLAAQKRTEADMRRNEILTNANAEAKAVMARGDAEAAKYYARFNEEPELAAFLRKLQAMKKIMSSKTTLILDTGSIPFDVFNGPNFPMPLTSDPPRPLGKPIPADAVRQ